MNNHDLGGFGGSWGGLGGSWGGSGAHLGPKGQKISKTVVRGFILGPLLGLLLGTFSELFCFLASWIQKKGGPGAPSKPDSLFVEKGSARRVEMELSLSRELHFNF